MHVNARAIVVRKTQSGVEIMLQLRNKPHEGIPTRELPGGRCEIRQSIIAAKHPFEFDVASLKSRVKRSSYL
jgi:hypothetical protein